jgi:hypothetical protein
VLGYYRAVMAELRVALELVMIGAYHQMPSTRVEKQRFGNAFA